MDEHDIKSVKNELFSITRIDPTVQKSFDGKKFLDDVAKEHPRKAKKILAKYTKSVNKSGYVSIKLKKEKDETK